MYYSNSLIEYSAWIEIKLLRNRYLLFLASCLGYTDWTECTPVTQTEKCERTRSRVCFEVDLKASPMTMKCRYILFTRSSLCIYYIWYRDDKWLIQNNNKIFHSIMLRKFLLLFWIYIAHISWQMLVKLYLFIKRLIRVIYI